MKPYDYKVQVDQNFEGIILFKHIIKRKKSFLQSTMAIREAVIKPVCTGNGVTEIRRHSFSSLPSHTQLWAEFGAHPYFWVNRDSLLISLVHSLCCGPDNYSATALSNLKQNRRCGHLIAWQYSNTVLYISEQSQ